MGATARSRSRSWMAPNPWEARPVCYSAQIRASYKHYVRAWGADISIKEFVRLYWMRSRGAKIKIPKAMDAAFADPQTDDERTIKAMIDAFDTEQATNLEQELF